MTFREIVPPVEAGYPLMTGGQYMGRSFSIIFSIIFSITTEPRRERFGESNGQIDISVCQLVVVDPELKATHEVRYDVCVCNSAKVNLIFGTGSRLQRVVGLVFTY